MASQERVPELLAREGLSLPSMIPPFQPQPRLRYNTVLVEYRAQAREILVSARQAEIERKESLAGKRHLFRALLKRASFLGPQSEKTWTFTQHEVAKAFDHILSQTPLLPIDITQALLAYATVTELDDLWWNFNDRKLERRSKSRFRRSSSALGVAPGNTWLQRATELADVDYVRLLCQSKPSKDALKQAFGIAIKSHSIRVMQILLEFGAPVNVYRQRFQDYVKTADIDIVELLLAFPSSIDTETWRFILRPHLESSTRLDEWDPGIVLLCISHRPDIVTPSMVLEALAAQDFKVLMIFRAYAPHIGPLKVSAELACEYACAIENDLRKVTIFGFLRDWDLISDYKLLREELFKRVQVRHFALIKLLTDAGVCLDMDPHASAHWVAARMDFQVLEILAHGFYSENVSTLLDHIPESATEDDILKFILLFRPRGLEGRSLHKHLIRAVSRREIRLTTLLIECGASPEYENARALHAALPDIHMLHVVLQGSCSPEVCSTLIPEVMTLHLGKERFAGVELILNKGVLNEALRSPLQELVSANNDADYELIELLLTHHAPTGRPAFGSSTPLETAIRKGNLPVVKMLCKAETSTETISEALPVTIDARNTNGHELTSVIVKLLCQNYAHGSLLDEALVASLGLPDGLDIALVLLQQGADANSQLGISFEIAAKCSNSDKLALLCEACPPTSDTLKTVLPTVLNPQYYNIRSLKLLLSTGLVAQEIVRLVLGIVKDAQHPGLCEIIPYLLSFGLNIDTDDGYLLRFAVENLSLTVLKELLGKRPADSSLKVAFQTAARMEQSARRFAFMEAILDHGRSRQLGQTDCLEQETFAALAGESACFKLLLRCGADVNYDDGSAIAVAARSGSLPVLKSLLECKPTSQTLMKVCLATESALLHKDRKHMMLKTLLAYNRSVTETEMQSLMAEAVERWPHRSSLVETLLELGTPISIIVLHKAIPLASEALFTTLMASVTDEKLVVGTFVAVRRSETMTPERRLWMCEDLLKRGLPVERISQALLETIEKDNVVDFALVRILLDYHASVDYRSGLVFKAAAEAQSCEAVRLLGRYDFTKRTAEKVFRFAVNNTALEPNVRYELYRHMLSRGLDSSLVYAALIKHLESHRREPAIVPLLLQYGADPNLDEGHCLILAAEAGVENDFRALSKRAKAERVLPALFKAFPIEQHVLRWTQILVEEQTSQPQFEDSGLLQLVMSLYPKGARIMNLVLRLGVPASTMTDCQIPGSEEAEMGTVLIWALLQQKRIDNKVILAFLEFSRSEALPGFTTTRTEVSAAFLCLLDPDRTPVLAMLLSLDREQILRQVIPGPTFGMLAAYPNQSNFDPTHVELRAAALYLGNLDAFRAIAGENQSVDEGALHSAAMLALPDFVTWLLELGLDPNAPNDEMDEPWIPLALVCISQPQPWCKIANRKSDIAKRREETMRILAQKTDPDWKCNHRTVLHIALDNGPDVTRAMVDALDIKNDKDRNNRYLYVDRGGIEYSPDMYVKHCMGLEEEGKKERLIDALEKADFKSRYFERFSL